MELDRDLQRQVLIQLKGQYPLYCDVQGMIAANASLGPNLFYLEELGLIEGTITDFMDGSRQFLVAKITAKGLDFLADDGGVSAILGVVTVKLHEETIRQILISRISEAEIPPEERSSLLQAIRNLPAKAIGTLTDKLLEKGAEQMLDGTPKLGTLLAQLAAQQFG